MYKNKTTLIELPIYFYVCVCVSTREKRNQQPWPFIFISCTQRQQQCIVRGLSSTVTLDQLSVVHPPAPTLEPTVVGLIVQLSLRQKNKRQNHLFFVAKNGSDNVYAIKDVDWNCSRKNMNKKTINELLQTYKYSMKCSSFPNNQPTNQPSIQLDIHSSNHTSICLQLTSFPFTILRFRVYDS